MRLKSMLLLFKFGRRRRKGEAEEPPLFDAQALKAPAWRCFSYEEVHRATNGFNQADNLVGRGGHAEVYRGVLEDGHAIAVKTMARASSEEQKEKDFLTELGTVGHVRHANVSPLIGCCIERGFHLIFEFASNGSVSSNLHDESRPPMEWKLRYDIALGTARGLHYLHKGCQRRIIHRDIKATNILLTHNFQPQISDFGLAKWLPSEWIHRTVKPIEGTFGCLAPEYFMHGIVHEKTDVFAFGVFLLEIISARNPVDGSHMSLVSWAKPYLRDGSIRMLVDSRLGDHYDCEQLHKLAFAASLCIIPAPTSRPSMTEVLNIIEGKEMVQDQLKLPGEDEEKEELWDFDDLDYSDEESNTSSSSTIGSSRS
ncbi:probable receptor-like serine/threonine-protein kinase At5g57670 isoform X1 [Zingiber officinale]|uniref:probable receptor-like serine/threonine-protein kinase At5g57670 isoform X1 n=1 Tax=Zingiber officinale TaxID=94328 RepID=UPI001C4BBABF|nr:probable receptor-like serine/threonine-protein kinase At5g57670 isoform X1 [Zingiber officinale]